MTDRDAQIMNAFAKVLREPRTDAGLSQEELAHRAGLSMRYVSLLGTVDALARSLGLSLTAFIAEVDAQARAGTPDMSDFEAVNVLCAGLLRRLLRQRLQSLGLFAGTVDAGPNLRQPRDRRLARALGVSDLLRR